MNNSNPGYVRITSGSLPRPQNTHQNRMLPNVIIKCVEKEKREITSCLPPKTFEQAHFST